MILLIDTIIITLILIGISAILYKLINFIFELNQPTRYCSIKVIQDNGTIDNYDNAYDVIFHDYGITFFTIQNNIKIKHTILSGEVQIIYSPK